MRATVTFPHPRWRDLSEVKPPRPATRQHPRDRPTRWRSRMPDQYEDLQQSYGRCLRDRNFIDRFYAVFMDSHPAIRPMFAQTDFGRQRLALRRGISSAIFHAARSPLSARTVEQMAQVHSLEGRAPVDPALYPYWIDSLLKVVAETDREADDKLLRRWREAMGVVCATFGAHYRSG
jgi:hemoglobin-like flavoprotein